MNYYPFHLGDYLSATRHLSWDEDAAYRRLLDSYYITEKPLPSDPSKVCRLVMATTEVQREAVKSVLEEFFSLTDAGWINPRADEEISNMRAKKEINERREAHEKERIRRYRERRAEMFEELRHVGIIPAWDVSTKELQRMFSEHCNAVDTEPVTDLKRVHDVSGNAPVTAIPTPTPTPTPIPTPNRVNDKSKRATRFDAQAHLSSLGVPDELIADWMKQRKAKKAEVTKTVIDDIVLEAQKAEMTLPEALRECCSRGWSGFKASWIEKEKAMHSTAARPQQSRQTALETRNAAVAANWIPPELRTNDERNVHAAE